MEAAAELVDIVDERGGLVRVTTRHEMRTQRLRHRCVFVLVRGVDGRVLVHRRSEDKDVWPGRWDLAAGGVLRSGEEWPAAAQRELAEELGVCGADLARLGGGVYEDAEVAEVAEIFVAIWDGAVYFADGEVLEARWVTPAELHHMIATLPFVPDSVAMVLPYVDSLDSPGGAP